MDIRAKMVGWYDPPRLAATAVRVAISTVFGEFADRREALAAAREIDPAALDPAYDYSGAGGHDFWFDFAADCGDGWNPTYAIARLLAQPHLRLKEVEDALPRGSLLVLGGDEVYPTASRDDYRTKLTDPYDEAAKGVTWETKPHLYAIPGNHDWYDGLSAFLGLFCRRRNGDGLTEQRPGREFGGRQTRQTRSYFALRLPNGWWLWGADIQLEGYIDQPQIDFFAHVAREWMPNGSQLILCTGQPSWSYVDPRNPDAAFKNFSYLETLATQVVGKRHRVRLVLSGDSHHYARYTEGDCQYITAGGGGAFLHPTHQLKEEICFDWSYPPPGQTGKRGRYPRTFTLGKDAATGKPSTFPDQATSGCLTWWNLAFFWTNLQYTATLGVLCGFFAWLLHAEAWRHNSSLVEQLHRSDGFAGAVERYLGLVFVSPWPLLLAGAALLGYGYMSDFPGWRRWAVGFLHGLVQTISIVALTCGVARLIPPHRWDDLCLIVSVAVVGGVIAATLLGLYFLISLNGFGRHWNEAFSSLRIEDYKNFLRLRIRTNGDLVVYPIGLTRVPAEPRTGELRDPDLSPHLIETPITITLH